MLNRPCQHQRGFSLIVALIALVIMALAAVSLMRTVSTATLVSGNMAFEQAAVTSADAGVEAAITWLENHNGQATMADSATCPTPASSVLACDQKNLGYLATRQDPLAPATPAWADVWTLLVNGGATAVAQPVDLAGNTASYLIQRMCSVAGDPSAANGCSSAPASADCKNSMASTSNAGAGNLTCSNSTYYRITVKVSGPRSTTAYIQAMVAL